MNVQFNLNTENCTQWILKILVVMGRVEKRVGITKIAKRGKSSISSCYAQSWLVASVQEPYAPPTKLNQYRVVGFVLKVNCQFKSKFYSVNPAEFLLKYVEWLYGPKF
jgi:hypothetical protein